MKKNRLCIGGYKGYQSFITIYSVHSLGMNKDFMWCAFVI